MIVKKKGNRVITFGTPESIGETNKKLILNRLRTRGNMSKADLSRSIGLSFTAVASNVKYLLDHGYVREVGAGDNAHGRKSTLLSFNAARGYVVGVDIGRTKIRCMLADLLGDRVTDLAVARRTGGDVTENVRAAVDAVVEESGVGANRVLCVCVGIPGVVREEKIYLAPNFADLSIRELRAELKRRYDAEVLVENGVNLGAIGEHRYGRGAQYADMVYISHGVGLGAALVLDGKLYTGFNNAAGEIGFMRTGSKSTRARFRETGELESAVFSAARKFAGRSTRRGMADMVRRYREGDAAAVSALNDIAAAMAMALVNICAVVNPRAIILSGGMGKSVGDIFLAQWHRHLASHLPFPPELLLSDLNERETMLGAVGTAVDYVETIPIPAT